MLEMNIVLSIIFLCQPSFGVSNDSLEKLFQDYFDWKKETYPEWASQRGFEGFSHLVENYTVESIMARGKKCQEFFDRSDGLEASSDDYEKFKNIFRVRRIFPT